MVPEIGQLALLFALVVAAWQVVLPVLVGLQGRWAASLATLQFLLVAVSFFILTYCFISNDFSVAYVANNSNSSLPLGYKISAVWGSHEGSLLLWMLILSGWSWFAIKRADKLPPNFALTMSSVLGMLSLGFLGFIVFTSNPFNRLLPYPPLDGGDLNPLLQDIGLILHPPILYSGYVGFAVPFAFAMAALVTGTFDKQQVRWLQPFTLVAWAMLSLGITLGSWWAYYELGWGGWWFWDPVENASLMPWLVGTALIHALLAVEKQGLLKKWALLLAIFAFALSLFGTFLVRSGVLTSVHAFASDPARGMYILVYLATCVGGALTVFAARAHLLPEPKNIALASRPGLILLGNIFLAAMAATVLLGTVYPLLLDSLGLGKISVGPPYFNRVVLPMLGVLLLLMSLLPALNWRSWQTRGRKALLGYFMVALVAALILPWFFAAQFSWLVLLGLALSIGLVMATLKVGVSVWQAGGKKLSGFGMVLAHLGMAILTIGATLTANYSVDRDLRFQVGQTQQVAGYDFKFAHLSGYDGPNYRAVQGNFEVTQNGRLVATLMPEKRVYSVKKMPISETAISVGWWRDLYVAMAEPIADDVWAVRVYYKPFVRWLWIGGLLMLAGGLVAATGRRVRA